jgi:hypothetical protein
MKRTLCLGIAIIGSAAFTTPAIAQGAADAAKEAKGNSGKEEKPPKDKEKEDPAADLLDSLKKGFQNKADDYQNEQKRLLTAIKSAKGEEREKLRDALRELQQTVKEEKEKYKDQVKEANEKLRDLADKLREETKESRDKAKPRDR